MISNYFFNNIITFREQRLKGWEQITGYSKFVAACVLGAFANIAAADYLQGSGMHWLLAACVGTGLGAVINFFFARFFIWNKSS